MLFPLFLGHLAQGINRCPRTNLYMILVVDRFALVSRTAARKLTWPRRPWALLEVVMAHAQAAVVHPAGGNQVCSMFRFWDLKLVVVLLQGPDLIRSDRLVQVGNPFVLLVFPRLKEAAVNLLLELLLAFEALLGSKREVESVVQDGSRVSSSFALSVLACGAGGCVDISAALVVVMVVIIVVIFWGALPPCLDLDSQFLELW